MSENVRDQVEDKHSHEEIHTARNMADAANAGQSLQGYASINGLNETTEIAGVHRKSEITELAHRYFQEREESGLPGSADGDWFRAEEEVRRRSVSE